MSRVQGFTLVESLVVIGIIALLISILLPALGRARESAEKVRCAANLRSMGQFYAMYVSQNRGKYPPALSSGSWVFGALSGPANTSTTPSTYPGLGPVLLWTTGIAKNPQVFFVPR